MGCVRLHFQVGSEDPVLDAAAEALEADTVPRFDHCRLLEIKTMTLILQRRVRTKMALRIRSFMDAAQIWSPSPSIFRGRWGNRDHSGHLMMISWCSPDGLLVVCWWSFGGVLVSLWSLRWSPGGFWMFLVVADGLSPGGLLE